MTSKTPEHIQHTVLTKRISGLDVLPKGDSEYTDWIHATGHLGLLRDNAKDDELVIFALCNHIFIHSVVVEESSLENLNRNTLLHWSGNPYRPCAQYEWAREGGYGVYRDNSLWGESLSNARQLVFGRELSGSKDGNYYEILQEYAHLADIHWRPERNAYCRFDELGNWEDVVSITHSNDADSLDLVTFRRQRLEQFLAFSNSALVRMFEFNLYNFDGKDIDWPEPEMVSEGKNIFYNQMIEAGKVGHYRGVQIIRPDSPDTLFSQVGFGPLAHEEREYAKFVAFDRRHKCNASISTNPSATTNHVQPKGDLPFALSAAFFNAEVLSKYKNDPDKYTIDEGHRTIDCRGGWYLKSYGVNDAGQIYAYICDLRQLPYKEQQYWKSFNEEPKDGISQRSVENDFLAQFSNITTPLEDLLAVMRRWSEDNVRWWCLREKGLEMDIHTPNNRQEWAQSFMSIAKLVIEGFKSDFFYKILEEVGKAEKKDKDRSIQLATQVLIHYGVLDSGARLEGLGEIQLIRSKCAAHPRGSEALMLEKRAIEGFGTYSAHFESVCRKTIDDLRKMERAFR